MAQPSDLVNPVPGPGGTPEPSYQSLFGGGRPQAPPAAEPRATPAEMMRVQQALNAEEAQQPAEPTFGAFMRQPPPERAVNPHTAPGQVKDFDKQFQEQDASVEKTLDEIRAELPRKEAREAENLEKKDEFDSLINDVKNELAAGGGTLATAGQFDENAGIASDNAGPVKAVQQGLLHAITRARAGLGRTNAEVKNAYISRYGKDNVEVKDGEIWFRRGSDEKYRRVNRKDLANGLDLLEDLLADNSGSILEGSVSAMTESLGLGLTGLAAFSLAGTPGAASVPGIVAGGTMGTLAAAATLGVGAREAAIRAVDFFSDVKQRDEHISLINEVAWNGGINAVTMGLGAVARPAVSKLKELAGATQMARIQQLAFVRNEFDAFAKGLGYSGEGLSKVGNLIGEALDVYSRRLGDAVQLVEKKALELARTANGPAGEEMSFSSQNTLKKLKELLGDRVGWDEHDMPYLLTKKEARTSALPAARTVTGVSSPAAPVSKEFSQQQLLDSAVTKHAFEVEQGERVLGSLIEEYKILSSSEKAKGGVPLQALLDFQGSYQHAVYDKAKGDAEKALFQQLRTAAEMDRNEALHKVFKGTGTFEEGTWKAAYDNFHEKIDTLTQLKALFSQRDSAAVFAQSLVQPDNVERVINVKDILGAGSKEWAKFRGEWFGHMMEMAVRPSSGVLEAGALLENLGKYGKPVINELLSQEEQATIKRMAVAATKIPYRDLLAAEDKDILRSVIAFAPMSQYDATRFRNIMHFIGRNKFAADYLLDEGFMRAAREAPTQEARATILSQARFFEEAVKRMKTAKITRTDPRGKSRIVEILVPVGKALARPAVRQGLTQALRPGATATTPIPVDESAGAPPDAVQ